MFVESSRQIAQKSIDNGVSKSDYAYNVRNELTSETQTLAGQPAMVVSYSSDADGLRLQMNSPSGSPVDYAWTAKGQLANISRDGPPPLANYTYDKAGRLTALAHENGITEEKSYNAASELLANLHKQGGTTVSGHGYTLDTTGRRTDETFPGSSTAARTYGYDTADQISSADYGSGLTDAYAYDAMGNRTAATVASLATSFTYSANNVNQYTSITGMSAPVHDANGNLTSQNGVTYTWDSENRLLSTTDGTTTNTFTYDSQHRRGTKRTAVSGTVTNKVHFIYDGWNVIEEYTNTDTTPGFDLTTFALTKTLTWGTDLSGSLQGAGGVGGLLMVEEISGGTTTAYHFQYDGNGNVTEITDSSGNNAASYRYDAFGNTLVSAGSYAAANKYRFSTKPIDAEITSAPLYYYGYRYYDPVTGRWPSRDPIEERGGINLYGFVYNDPYNWFDDLGNKPRQQRDDERDRRRRENERNRKDNRNRENTQEIGRRANKGSGKGEDLAGALKDGLGTVSYLLSLKQAKEKCLELLKEAGCKNNCGSCRWSVAGTKAVQGGTDAVELWYLWSASVKCEKCSESSEPTFSAPNIAEYVNPVHEEVKDRYAEKLGPKYGCTNHTELLE